jgi:hypothetical protein
MFFIKFVLLLFPSAAVGVYLRVEQAPRNKPERISRRVAWRVVLQTSNVRDAAVGKQAESSGTLD